VTARRPRPRAALLLIAAAGAGCTKVPLEDVEAGFSRADAAWFAEEQTLFFFYEVEAAQGISRDSVVEVTWVTDDGRQDWTPIGDLDPVHLHLPVDCGPDALCGSQSVAVARQPREVALRMRYHRDGEMALEGATVFNSVGPGTPHANRSMVVYGVLDETNRRVQWRGRHQFPTVRNEDATALGLRRELRVSGARAGTVSASDANPYGYGVPCPSGLVDAGLEAVRTFERAVFQPDELIPSAWAAPSVCAQATVRDATGPFTTSALARKNPAVRPAFPELRSPITEAVPLEFFLSPCERDLSADHEAMQRERLRLTNPTEICIDGWDAPGFEDRLVRAFDRAVADARPRGRDMALIVGLHREDAGVSQVVEAAIGRVTPGERDRSSPRLVGAFVFDSAAYAPDDFEVARTTLWCPAPARGSLLSAVTAACTVVPNDPELVLGPLSVDTLPILPTRDEYLDFIDTYSKRQAGEVRDLGVLAPTFTTTTDHVDFGEIGVVTFLNDEVITADADDAFSYCVGDAPDLFAFRSPLLDAEAVQELIDAACDAGELPDEVCVGATAGALPLQLIGEWHATFGDGTYDLGVFWQFPFLVTMDVEVVAAGAATAFGVSLPFGFAGEGEVFLGWPLWEQERYSLVELLTQCDRYCDHPTFDAAGIYQVRADFRSTYTRDCYAPALPTPGDGGFPRDP
jgi:hypothetical protein